jgi:DDE superfamily endonuclease
VELISLPESRVVYDGAVTRADLDRWSADLADLFARMRPVFYRTESRRHAEQYLRGLLGPLERKNGWTIAEYVGESEPKALQRFLNLSPWKVDRLLQLNREYVLEHFGSPSAILVADPTGFAKKGTKSVGVQRQYSGTLGRIDNCQIATFLAYVTPDRDRVLLDCRLYLPKESWIADPVRCAEAGVPADTAFKTRPQQVAEMIDATVEAKVPFRWFTADEEFGQNPGLREHLQKAGISYVMAVPKNTPITDPVTCRDIPFEHLAVKLNHTAWQRRACGIGSKGFRVYDWDTDSAPLRNVVKPGNTSAVVKVASGPDCLVWVAQVFSIGRNGAADTDGDKLLDGWEANGYDADGNNVIDVNLPAFGSNVVRKDLFVEMDYMGAETTCPCRLPLAADLARIVSVFAAAPQANNPNGQTGIALHLDAGPVRGSTYNLGGGNLVPDDPDLNPVVSQFSAIKSASFNPVRAKIFYYMIWANRYNGGGSSGNAFAIPNDSFVVTLGAFPSGGTSDQKVGTFIHEFGHNLGQYHGGNSSGQNYKPNYLSVMNYSFQLGGVPRTGTLAPYFGYSSSVLPTLNEASLNEAVGLNSSAASTYKTRWFCPNDVQVQSPGTANGPLDWNCNGTASGTVSVDVNNDNATTTLVGWNNWGTLVYGGGAVGPGDAPPSLNTVLPDELTWEEASKHAH